MSVYRDVRDHADELKKQYIDLTNYEALQLATKIVEIEAYKEANVTDREKAIPALEAIAICLGMSSQFSVTITDAVSSVAQAMNNVAEAIEKHEA